MPGLEEAIGYRFTDRRLLRVALTHPSLAGEGEAEHNQRLEFLGDAVLQLTMSARLYLTHPGLMEGALSRLRARSVQERALCEAARELRLGGYLHMGRGEEMTGGRNRPSILADAMEALLGAVYLDGGYDAARAVVERCLPTAGEDEARDFKTELQERLQLGGGSPPSYHIIEETGPMHKRVFVAEAARDGRRIGLGEGSSKKAAEQAAARAALEGGGT